MNQVWGWRGRVGLIMPTTQTVTEPLFYATAPEGLSFHTARFVVEGSGPDSIARTDTQVPEAVDKLAKAKVDCIAYLCVVGGLARGLEKERQFCQEIENRTGIPVVSALLSVFEALNLFKIGKLVITGPYAEAANKLEEKLFTDNGFQVLGVHGLGITNGFEFGQVPADEIYSFCKQVWDSSADGLFIACVAFNAMPIAERLELELEVPVVTAHSAVLWKILKTLAIKEPLRGYGRLLREHL